jgi:hypothetical protein
VTELCDGLTTRPLTTDDAQAVFEVIAAFTLGRTLKKRAVDVLACVEHPFWIRIHPSSVTGRRTPGTGARSSYA